MRAMIAMSGGVDSSVAALLMKRSGYDCAGDGVELDGVLVGDHDAELVLERHDQLDDVERIGADVVDEVGVEADGLGIDLELLGQHVSDFFKHGRILRYE